MEKGWITRAQAAERTLSTLRFLWLGRQGPEPQGVMGYKGFFYHFLDARTGHRAAESELSTIDTALLMAGVLDVSGLLRSARGVRARHPRARRQLYLRVDWAWAMSPKHPPLLSMGWTPEQGYLPYDWQGYNEAMILYLLALGSPTHAIEPRAWDAWTSTYRWDASDGFPRVAFDPLFGHQYSHIWIDFRGIQDPYMRSKGIDYFVNSTRATYANRAYCIANPAKWVGYDEFVWGLTASDGPLRIVSSSESARAESPFHAYWARGAGPDGRDDGTIAVTAAGGSVPFAPELAIPTLLQFRTRFGDRLYGKYGFKDAFNLSFAEVPSDKPGWFDDQYVAIDQGPILLMIENFLTGRIWSLTKSNAYLRAGLIRAGFTGGWLDGAAQAPIPMPKPSESPARSRSRRKSGRRRRSRDYGSMITDTGTPWTESGAIRTSSVAGSTTCFIWMFQNESSSLVSVNSTWRVCPGASRTRWKPLSSLTGRATLVPVRRM